MNNAFENIPAISNTRGKKKTSIQEKKKSQQLRPQLF